MIRIRKWSFILSLTIISCNQSKRNDYKNSTEIMKYSIVYTNNSYANLIVFDNNDTIYLSNIVRNNINNYTKIKSDNETINSIKKAINNHLSYKNLLVERDFILHSGYLDVSINCGDKKIEFMQTKVKTDLRVSKGFYNMISNLKNKYKEIDLIF